MRLRTKGNVEGIMMSEAGRHKQEKSPYLALFNRLHGHSIQWIMTALWLTCSYNRISNQLLSLQLHSRPPVLEGLAADRLHGEESNHHNDYIMLREI